MAISVQSTIPASSDFYSTGGDVTITLAGIQEVMVHSKKDLIKIKKAKTEARQDSEDSDKFDNSILDLKMGTDEVVIKGWLTDDSVSSAWEKFWQLRAMCSRGGPITNLTIDNIEFKSVTQEAFLEDVSGTAKADDSGALNTNKLDDRARVEVALSFFIGDER